MESRDADELWCLINEEITDAILSIERARAHTKTLVKIIRDEVPIRREILECASLSGTVMLMHQNLKELKEMYFVLIPEEDKTNGDER
jgi:hypothetical protein